MAISIGMPGGINRNVEPDDVLVIRNATSSERAGNAEIRTAITTSSGKLYPADSLDDLQTKFASSIKLAALKAPNNMNLYVSMSRVLNVEPAGAQYPDSARAVLRFGSTATAPFQAVRETSAQLKTKWKAAGVTWPGP
jgi:hypothetical protein